ncbi:MAG: O-methyltransferase [Bdellovibrionales bacterium]|nr:O-methyltransferase [Bdellovibrionales bacterium]
MSTSRLKRNKKQDYLNQTFSSHHTLLNKITQETKKESVLHMQISSHEGRLLEFLVKLSKAKKIVEIGTLYAYSTFYLARAIPKGGKVWSLDSCLKRHKKCKEIFKNSNLKEKIEWLTGPAKESLELIKTKAPFDAVFIDADKESYLDYLKWAKAHLKQGGLLIADNTFLFGSVYGEPEKKCKPETLKVMREFNKALANLSFWQGALIPTLEGMTVGIKL